MLAEDEKGTFFCLNPPLMASSLVVTTRGCALPDVGGQKSRVKLTLAGAKSHIKGESCMEKFLNLTTTDDLSAFSTLLSVLYLCFVESAQLISQARESSIYLSVLFVFICQLLVIMCVPNTQLSYIFSTAMNY